jgi:tetratricopeptide (TPR) repeat protein
LKQALNSSCQCGSGKKFKRCCHGKAASPAQPAAEDLQQLIKLFNAANYRQLETEAIILLERYPQTVLIWKMLAGALLGQNKQVIPIFEVLAKLTPNDADAHNCLGDALLNAGQYQAAAASYRTALQFRPELAELHYNLANALANCQELDQAMACYRQAVAINPGFADAYNNLGIALRNTGQIEESSACYLKALELKADFAQAHYNLGNNFRDTGHLREAVNTYQKAISISPEFADAHNNLGNAWRDLGQADAAINAYRQALEIQPGFAQARNNLGNALLDSGRLEEAIACYKQALELNPHYPEAYYNLGNAYRDLNQIEPAILCYRQALQNKPDYIEALSNLGNVLRNIGQFDEALACYYQALEINPNYAKANLNLGKALMVLGKMSEAEHYFTKAIELAPAEVAAIASLLSLVPYQQSDPRFSQLEAAYEQRHELALEDQIKLNFAMGKAMANQGEYHKSFTAYQEANHLRYQQAPFDESADILFLENTYKFSDINLFSHCAALSKSVPAATEKRTPIFIVGMPRSGTTLIEQILASHPAVFGGGELTMIDEIAKNPHLFPENLQNMQDMLIALRKLGREYLDRVWKLAPDADFITDKMPDNYRFLGLIHLMLPNAKIIHAIRDPMDTCFSCYTMHFTHGHEYSFDLHMLGKRYKRYQKLMQHWHQVLPTGRILDLHYEDNVANPEAEAKRLLDFLGLPWDPACLKFYETRRAVNTASVSQVRKPIYDSSIARWKHFRPYLRPLQEIIDQDGLTDEQP